MTRHTNSKHRESDPELSTESGNNHNCLLLEHIEDLAGVVESIKTNLIAGDLYGPVINTDINTKLINLYIKLDPSERGPLSYIAGYIVSKLYQKSKNNSELQALLQALKSTGQDNEFILARSRGGLVAPSRHLMAIAEAAELCFRKNVSEGKLVLRNIPTDTICESTLSSPMVKSLWETLFLKQG